MRASSCLRPEEIGSNPNDPLSLSIWYAPVTLHAVRGNSLQGAQPPRPGPDKSTGTLRQRSATVSARTAGKDAVAHEFTFLHQLDDAQRPLSLIPQSVDEAGFPLAHAALLHVGSYRQPFELEGRTVCSDALPRSLTLGAGGSDSLTP